MATTYHNAIQQLYVAYFNRPADPAGLAFWETVMEGNGGNSAVISAEFAKSGEYTSEYDQLTTSGVVTQVYQNLFGHAPDSAGLAFWVKALNDRAMTVDTMVAEISKGAQGTDKVAFDSKVVVATAFTNALNTEAEIAAYNNEDAQAEAKELLSTIKTAAQATAAIVPATLDAHVAAVVKAGTPFTLESGLAALGVANEAVADFLTAYGKEHKIKDATADHVEDAVEAAEVDLTALINDDGFAGASEGVQAALIADQVAYNAAASKAAQAAMAAAQKAVNDVKGLGAAIATVTSATEAADEAIVAEKEALADLDIAEATLERRNATADIGVDGSVTVVVDGEVVTVAEIEGDALIISEDVDAADFPGLSAYVSAFNAYEAAQDETVASADAALIAQMQVEVLENASVSTEGKFTLTLTNKTVTKPTVAQISDELSALAAADHPYYETFRKQVEKFNSDNKTPKADALVAAEVGKLAQAQAAVDAVEGLNEAVAFVAADKAAIAETNEFKAAHTTLTVAGNGGVTVTEGGAAVVTVEADGTLKAATGMDNTDYAGLTDYIAAYNAAVVAAKAYVEADTGYDADDFVALSANDTLLKALDTQQKAVALAPAATSKDAYAAYVAALGAEGASEAVEDLNDAIDALEDAQADFAELESLQDAAEAAIADFTANDYNAPTVLGASAFGRTGSDIFVAVEDQDSTITNFGRSGDDVLYIGEGFKLNAGDLEDGVNADLEVFFIQQGNNTIVTIETKAYGSESDNTYTITLTGVDADDLTFENGIISL